MLRLKKWFQTASLGLVAIGAAGCADSTADGGPGNRAPTGKVRAALVQAEDCPDLLTRLQEDAIAKLDLEIELYEKQQALYDDWSGTTGGRIGFGDVGPAGGGALPPGAPLGDPAWDEDVAAGDLGGGPATGTGGTATTGFAPAPMDGSGAAEPRPTTSGSDDQGNSAGENGGGSVADPVGGSDTNNQVREVDEADFVKMVQDRTRFYLLHGQQLFALDSWPADALSVRDEPLTLEGGPQEMFVHDGTAVVFSTVNRHDLALDPGGDAYRYQPFTKVTVVQLGDSDMKVVRELYIEGSYTSSRRYDSLVRVALQAESPAPHRFTPDIQYHDDWGRPFSEEDIDAQLEAWRERTIRSIEATDLSDWLPQQYELQDGELAALEPACPSHYLPTAGAAAYGLTRVVTLNLETPQESFDGVTVLGASSVVYSNLSAMVLAQNDYRWDARDFGVIDEQQTALHVFEIDGDATHYAASGWAPGHVLNQFALGEQDGVVRLSTSGRQRRYPAAEPGDMGFWATRTVNQVLTFSVDEGALTVLDTTGPIGKEDEVIESTRFIGDRAYVVTFRQIDPLIVVDLSDPASLEVLGELEIPGFSEYIHPLGDDHLLTIGTDGTETGVIGGVALQIFDVSDPTAPRLAHRHAFSPSSSSSAQYDHKAFTFYEEQGLLAFPMVDYGTQFQSTLQVFEVSTGSGFSPLGAVDHSALFSECAYQYEWGYEYGCGYQPDVRRGMFVEGEEATFVYTVSYGGVTAHALDALDDAVASVDLPEPKIYYGGGYYPTGPGRGGISVGGDTAPPPAEGIPVDDGPQDAGVGTAAPDEPEPVGDAPDGAEDGGVDEAADGGTSVATDS